MVGSQKRKRSTVAKGAAGTETAGLNQSQYRGWCPIDSDPAFFSALLHELGAHGVVVEEIVSLDDESMAVLPQPVLAVIFLFRYCDVDSLNQETESGTELDNVWFARQLPANACASVALLNIVNNLQPSQVSLSTDLCSLKQETISQTPHDRGRAIAHNSFIKTTHNSFARELDMLENNLLVKWKHEKLLAEQKWQKRECIKAAEGTRKSTRRVASREEPTDLQDRDQDVESSFHFIAYMPINGRVWKLDGMDKSPHTIGAVQPSQAWFDLARDAIQARMMQYEGSQIEFNLMAVVADSTAQSTDTSTSNDSVAFVKSLAKAAVLEKAELRRHDYKPFFTAWIQELRKQGSLDELKERLSTSSTRPVTLE